MRWRRGRSCVPGNSPPASGDQIEALKFLGRAYGLAPQERSVALLYAGAKLAEWRVGGGRGAA